MVPFSTASDNATSEKADSSHNNSSSPYLSSSGKRKGTGSSTTNNNENNPHVHARRRDASYPYVTSYDAMEHRPKHTKFHYEEHWEIEEREMIRKFMIDRNIEIIALVEGQDALTGTFMQLHYRISLIITCCRQG
jgi:hypothetical protein